MVSAGLLHDAGKFAQRAAEGKHLSWNDESKREFKYQHALFTDGVVEQIVPVRWREGMRGAAGRHHRPTNHLERVVSLADRLSAGERSDSGEKQPKLLQSIFCSLDGLDGKTPETKYLPLKKLTIDADTIFPVAEKDDSHWTYQKLWDDFLNAAKELKAAHEDNGDRTVYLESLLNLMQQYAWAIPSAYYHSVPDVSLYDHSRMTAALAACLVKQDNAKILRLLAKQGDEPVALLVGGDISGVQNFIYTITSKGATGGLRGRSMYLQLLTEVIARYVLNQFDLPRANIIYAGGGHFFMLLPAGVEAELAEIQRTISRILLHHHQGDLYLALSWQSISASQAAGDGLRDSWETMQKGLQQRKQRKFAELGAELTTLLFAPKEHGGNEEKQCAVCQREHPGINPQDAVKKCPPCRQFEELGKDLRRANYLTLDRIKVAPLPAANNPPGDWRAVLGNFGYRTQVGERLPASAESDVRARTLWALNDEARRKLHPSARQSIGRHLLVNVTPILTRNEYNKFKTDDDDLPKRFIEKDAPVKPFDIMAQQSRGIRRLGVLRMDVDNLGQILSRGFKGDKFTFSRIAALSFNISLFFEGWLEEIARQINTEGRKAARKGVDDNSDLLYSIYSGGDDLFFVGAWDLMPLLAEKISVDLKAFTAKHPAIHISGGIALIPAKYPLYQAANDAAEAEGYAKSPRRDGGEKNALNFLGQTVAWDKFSDEKSGVREYQRQLEKLITKRSVPKSLLQRLVKLYIEFDDTRKKQEEQGKKMQVYWGPGQWQSAYSLTRFADQNKNVKDEIIKLRDDLHLDNFNNIEWLGLAARWAGLITRKGEQ